jgi:hypothetical protein
MMIASTCYIYVVRLPYKKNRHAGYIKSAEYMLKSLLRDFVPACLFKMVYIDRSV